MTLLFADIIQRRWQTNKRAWSIRCIYCRKGRTEALGEKYFPVPLFSP